MHNNKSDRLYLWDNAKGILIALVVFGHFLTPYRSIPEVKTIFDIIYFFHMPAFVFVSGYLSRLTSDNRKAILKLCIAYALFNFPMMVYVVLHKNNAPSLLTPYYSFWYLLALIAWRLIVPTISKTREILFFSIFTAVLIGFWNEIDNTLAISRIIGFLPFFLAGYMLDENKLSDFFKKRRLLHTCLGLTLLAITLYLSIIISQADMTLSDLLFFPYATPGRFIFRIFILLISAAVIVSSGLILPESPIYLLTRWGRNSLSIYILHRFITLVATDLYPLSHEPSIVLIASITGTILTLFMLGLDRLSSSINLLIAVLSDAIAAPVRNARGLRMAFCIFLLCHLFFVIKYRAPEKADVSHAVLTAQQNSQITNAISIAFVGDIILLRDQIRRAYSAEKQEYDFSPVFEYAKKHLLTADLAIGVFEGPMAGKDEGYSTSNYGDGIPLYLNFPDSFVDSVIDSGIDLVTLANNHILDMGEEGASRTRQVLDAKKLKYVGSYSNISEKNQPKIVGLKGLRIAILAYSFPSNYYSEDYFFDINPSLTSVIVGKSSRYFSEARSQVHVDFERAKAENPDLIVVLPHMGTQFIHETDTFQKTWNEIFINEGADIILGDHSHAVQPVEFRKVVIKNREKQVVIVNSPGNFVNSYIEHNGDATSIVKVFIDSETKSVICAGIIPMITQAFSNGQHRALPIIDILNDTSLRNHLSLLEMKRVQQVQSLVTKVMLGTELSLDQAQNLYYLFPDGYYRQPVAGIHLEDNAYQNDVRKMFETASSVLFIGDSVTHGTKNGGYGWYEPLTASLPMLQVAREAWGSATTITLLDNLDTICSHKADLYVIAIGTNDIRYRDARRCAMTPQQYIANLERLTEAISQKSPDASFIFIAPWPSLENDPFIKIPQDKKRELFSDYYKALESFCKKQGYRFVDPTQAILTAIDKKISGFYLLDHIHPNANDGLRLYSEAFMSSRELTE
ncbi:MAG: hypothetical protein GQF41_3663 [Candidatus Rifleibacterium amylolyticum]|nr:MAG: hypothetical protein GQF41_3663 [Candidatus Rifleibacterium amylolyticum]